MILTVSCPMSSVPRRLYCVFCRQMFRAIRSAVAQASLRQSSTRAAAARRDAAGSSSSPNQQARAAGNAARDSDTDSLLSLDVSSLSPTTPAQNRGRSLGGFVTDGDADRLEEPNFDVSPDAKLSGQGDAAKASTPLKPLSWPPASGVPQVSPAADSAAASDIGTTPGSRVPVISSTSRSVPVTTTTPAPARTTPSPTPALTKLGTTTATKTATTTVGTPAQRRFSSPLVPSSVAKAVDSALAARVASRAAAAAVPPAAAPALGGTGDASSLPAAVVRQQQQQQTAAGSTPVRSSSTDGRTGVLPKSTSPPPLGGSSSGDVGDGATDVVGASAARRASLSPVLPQRRVSTLPADAVQPSTLAVQAPLSSATPVKPHQAVVLPSSSTGASPALGGDVVATPSKPPGGGGGGDDDVGGATASRSSSRIRRGRGASTL